MGGQHTPGPWAIDENWLFDEEHPEWRAVVSEFDDKYNRMSVSGHIGEANARLIATAPELLELARQYRNDMLYPPAADSRERRVAWIDALLAKALGQEGGAL